LIHFLRDFTKFSMVTSDLDNQGVKKGSLAYSNSLNATKKSISSFDSSDETKTGTRKIRVGQEYQAMPPPYIPPDERRPEVIPDRALLVWAPSSEDDCKLDRFIQVARDTYGYSIEQALGMLFWHKKEFDSATNDLANFTPFPDDWSTEDKVIFEQAFGFHGKSFERIRQMLPDKSIAAIVKYYYSWKKTRVRTSQIGKQVKRLSLVREGEGLYGEEILAEESVDTNSDETSPSQAVSSQENCTSRSSNFSGGSGGGVGQGDGQSEAAVKQQETAECSISQVQSMWCQ